MKDFFVPNGLLLLSDSMGMNSDFSVRGFSAGAAEDNGTLTVTVTVSAAGENTMAFADGYTPPSGDSILLHFEE